LGKLDQRSSIKIQIQKLILTYTTSLIHSSVLFSSPIEQVIKQSLMSNKFKVTSIINSSVGDSYLDAIIQYAF